MSIAFAALIVLGFLFSVGCCCGCSCTSCSRTDDEAMAPVVTVTGLANGACTGCANANGTYNTTHDPDCYFCPAATVPFDFGFWDVCCYYAEMIGTVAIDCNGPNPCDDTIGANAYLAFVVGSNADWTGEAEDCDATRNIVYLWGDVGVSCHNGIIVNVGIECTNIGFFTEVATPILDCTAGSYTSRPIPPMAGGVTRDCDWTGATCTVTV